MGRRKFRLSDMMPNSWFHKLHDMRRAGGRSSNASAMHRSSLGGARSGTQPAATPRPVPVPVPRRSSYYCASRDRVLQPSPARAATEVNRQLAPQTQSPSRSSHRRRHKVGPVTEAPVTEAPDVGYRRRDMCIARGGGGGDGKQYRRRPAVKAPSSKKDTFTGKVIASDTDIIFDLHNDDVPERVLRPIMTKPKRREDGSRYEVKERHVGHHGATMPRTSCASEQGSKGNSRRSSVSSGRRLKTRANSPRLASSRSRKSKSTNPAMKKTTPAPPPPLAGSFAVVKASTDPRRDFRESMEEMIAAKGIRGAGDLEDLLACYLAVNAAKHHDLIVEVFEEIWTSLPSVVNP